MTETLPRRDSRYIVALAAFAAAALFILWVASHALLLIFAGVVFGAFLDALSRLLGRFVGGGHAIRLAAVCVVIAALVIAGIVWGSAALAAEASDILRLVREQFGEVAAWLQRQEIPLRELAPAADSAPPPAAREADGSLLGGASRTLFPDLGGFFGTAWTAAGAVFGAVGNAAIIAFLGVCFAAQPALYRDTLLLLLPPQSRPHARNVLDEAGDTLRHWLIGQSITMTVIFVVTWLGLWLVGVEPSFALGLQAGLLAFIPNIGAFIAGVVIVLASLAGGLSSVIAGLAVYLIVQTLESYILTPMIQKRAVRVPEAFLFASQIVLGVLFGLYGLALALPLTALARVFILRFYVEDALGDEAHELRRDGGA